MRSPPRKNWYVNVTRKKRPPKPWTDHEKTLIRDSYMAGRSVEWIAQEFGSTKGAVKVLLHRIGVKRPSGKASLTNPPGKALGKRGGLAALFQALSGRLGREVRSGPLEPTEDAARVWLEDPAAWIDAFAPFKLLPYQRDMIATVHGNPHSVLLCARQVGKSTIASYYATWWAYTHPGAVVLIVAAVERQSTLDLEMVRGLVQGHPALAESVVELTQTFVRLENGGRLYSLPAGTEGNTIRGFSADLILLDEAARVPEEVFAALLPMVATKPDAKIVLASTPRGRLGFFFECTRNPAWRVFRVMAEDSPLVDKAYLEKMERSLAEDIYRMEFRAEFIDEATSAFPYALLDAAEDPTLEMDT
jgi:hypothetical protein